MQSPEGGATHNYTHFIYCCACEVTLLLPDALIIYFTYLHRSAVMNGKSLVVKNCLR